MRLGGLIRVLVSRDVMNGFHKACPVAADRRADENLKIECGRRHFALADGVSFRDVSSLSELVDSGA